jgi:hypothetical protein
MLSVHIIEPPSVRLLLAYGMGLVARVALIPRILPSCFSSSPKQYLVAISQSKTY